MSRCSHGFCLVLCSGRFSAKDRPSHFETIFMFKVGHMNDGLHLLSVTKHHQQLTLALLRLDL